MSNNTKIYDEKNMEKMINDAKDTLSKLRDFSGYARVLVGNDCIEIISKVLKDKRVRVEEIKNLKISKAHGDLKFSEFIDIKYIKNVAKISNGYDKRDDDVKVSFSKEARKWLNDFGIVEELKVAVDEQ